MQECRYQTMEFTLRAPAPEGSFAQIDLAGGFPGRTERSHGQTDFMPGTGSTGSAFCP